MSDPGIVHLYSRPYNRPLLIWKVYFTTIFYTFCFFAVILIYTGEGLNFTVRGLKEPESTSSTLQTPWVYREIPKEDKGVRIGNEGGPV